MAISLMSKGQSAQILNHPTIQKTPVVQSRQRGRLPKCVASMSAFLRKKEMEKIFGQPKESSAMAVAKIQELEKVLSHLTRTVKITEYELAVAKQLSGQ